MVIEMESRRMALQNSTQPTMNDFAAKPYASSPMLPQVPFCPGLALRVDMPRPMRFSFAAILALAKDGRWLIAFWT